MSHLNNQNAFLYNFKLIHNNLYTKYSDKNNYQINTINNILANNKSLVVAKFKDFLLYGDLSEFLKRFYQLEEIGSRLRKLYYFFHKYILIQPNYCLLNESKYLISNILRKQMLINKGRKNKHKKKLLHKKENEYKLTLDSVSNFFNNTLYSEILNQSESFMNTLFGIDIKNNKNNNYLQEDNDDDDDAENITKIIKLIENSEHKKNKMIKTNNIKKSEKINMKKLNIVESACKINYKHKRQMTNYFNSSNYIINSDTLTLINTNPDITSILNRYEIQKKLKEKNKVTIDNNKVQQKKEINKEINEKNINDSYQDKKIVKGIYHRKMKSTLIGEYLNKLELPSNSNIVNSLKKVNEAFAKIQKNTTIKMSLYNKTNISSNDNKNSKEKIQSTKIIFQQQFNYNNKKRDDTNNSKIYETPLKKKISFYKNLSNMYIPKTEVQKTRITKNKRNSPIYVRNHIATGSFLNSNKKMLYTNKSRVDIKQNFLLNTFHNTETKNKNNHNNSNIKEVYLKPKALYKNKTNGLSQKKLFNN